LSEPARTPAARSGAWYTSVGNSSSVLIERAASMGAGA
jgi:hypothetical protein